MVEWSDSSATVYVDVQVEMPLHYRARGASPNGVQKVERLEILLNSMYPWRSPVFFLREDFPQDLPHLEPGLAGVKPRPCLIDGSQDEFFSQFGLIELGIIALLNQAGEWLAHAAIGALIDEQQGWEPVLRHNLNDTIVFDSAYVRSRVGKRASWCCLESDYLRYGDSVSQIGVNAEVFISARNKLINPRNSNNRHPIEAGSGNDRKQEGRTITAVIYGDPETHKVYLPETVTDFDALRERAAAFGAEEALDSFIKALELGWRGWTGNANSLPVGIILTAQRPFHLIGSDSPIELLP